MTLSNLERQAAKGKKKMDKADKKAMYVTSIDEISATIVLIFCALAIPFKLKSLWKICDCFNQIEKTVSVKTALDCRKKSIYLISTVLVLYSTIYLFDIIVWHTKLEKIESYKLFLLDYIPYYFLKYILLSHILFFCHLVYFVKIRIFCLNQLILTDINTPMALTIGGQKLHFSKVLRIFELANCQKTLFEAVSIITGTSAFGVVLLMLSFLLHLTSSSFFLLTEVERNGNIYFICLQSMWLIAHIGKLFMIIETCQHCTKESERTMYIVHNLLTNDVGTVKNAFVAAITTYLVVLLQLKN